MNAVIKSGRDANKLIKAGTLTLSVNEVLNDKGKKTHVPVLTLAIPGLDLETTNMEFIKEFLLLGGCKILSDDIAGAADTPKAIRECIDAWKDGYVGPGAKKKALKALSETATSGKSGKLGYSQLQVCSALRSTLGSDDPRIAIIEGFNDERFGQFMALKSNESYMVDALTFLKKQDEQKAQAEADKLAAELAALGL